jgi:maltooligosyltrehalose trehalohydrolase
MKKKRFSVEQIVGVLKQAELGVPVAEVIRKAGISEQTFYRWKAKYAGLEVDQVGNRALGERLEHLCGMKTAKVAIGLVLTAPYVPMLFMGEEFATSAPFLYFADHEDEEMRKNVAEGRKKDFSQFGFGGEVPNPEELKTFEDSKLGWDEVSDPAKDGGKHAEMLTWLKELIKLRRCTVALNGGSMQHLMVSTDEVHKTLVMQRDEARVVVNFGTEVYPFQMLEGEEVRLLSDKALKVVENRIEVLPMTMAVLLSSTEQTEDREVERG